MNAKQSLSSISANQDLWVAQFRQEMFERDYRSGMSAAEARGEERAKLEAARNMLAMNLGTPEQIAQAVRLPVETIQQLSNHADSAQQP